MSQSRSYSDLFRDTVQAGLRDDSIQNVDVVQKRSYSDSSPNNFAEASSPLDEFLQHPKCLVNSSVLDSTVPFSKIRPQSLRRQNSTESTSQISSDGSRPCSSANSRPGSAEYNQTDCSDENAASQRFRDFQSETSDDFGYFFTFKDTLNEYSDRLLSEFKQDNQIQDFPVTFAKIASSTRKTNNSSEQSPERETGTGIWNVQRDMSNLSLTTKMLDEAKEGEMRKEENSAEEQSIFDYDITYDSFKEDITKNDCTIAEANSEQSYASAHDQQQACTSKDLIEISSIINDEKLDEEKLKSPKEPDDTNVEQQPYEKHSCSQLLYCQTCYKRICTECVSSCCRGHVTTNFSKYLRTIELQAEEILDEAYNGIDILTDDMEDVMLDMSTLNKRATEAIASVQFSSHVMLAAVEEREKELFRQITEVRQWKYDALHEKYANLRDDQARLAEAVHALKYVLYEMRSHPSEIMKMKDRVMAEIWQICQNRRTSSRSDQENWISFKGTENNVIPVIANVGSVSARSPGVIGDRKTESFSKFDEMNLQHGPIAFGRPILNYDFNINLANRETNLYVYSTEVTIIGYHGENSDKNLSRPWGVAVDTDGNIIVSDRSNNRIQIYQSDGTLINQFGQYGSGECEFNRPAGITVDAKRRIIVADKDNHRVQMWRSARRIQLSLGNSDKFRLRDCSYRH
ncbi:E3 ubiquitin-protein ligase TRIM71-like isoform X2 [Pseudomyrmex gracilis]|uniref:E3 ubiquitin-protein ligase TRIM71-like isoform X2 n=1 Tax=Pseudomyrmex gracilis TaxID=219809 RepID=UPI0009950CBA|nr:E3 ubiquitin-protein ligase TRIM71-like isoform X2 [Pseudomyrmex gracilis]